MFDPLGTFQICEESETAQTILMLTELMMQ